MEDRLAADESEQPSVIAPYLGQIAALLHYDGISVHFLKRQQRLRRTIKESKAQRKKPQGIRAPVLNNELAGNWELGPTW